jgi:hypothetical protein
VTSSVISPRSFDNNKNDEEQQTQTFLRQGSKPPLYSLSCVVCFHLSHLQEVEVSQDHDTIQVIEKVKGHDHPN